MRKIQKKYQIANYITIILLLLFFGCSIEKNHKLLAIFFDGIDQVNYKNDYLSKDSLNKDAIIKRELALKKNRPDKCVHMPYKERKCYESCHTPDKKLQKPLPQLCYQCHTDFSKTYQYVHGPIASGSCLKCHHQHYATYDKLLIRQGQDVCTYCHNSAVVFKSKYHKSIEDVECTKCHNPHGGNNRAFLWDKVAKGFKGQSVLADLASKHLTGQLYNSTPGDVKAGTVVEIVNDNNEVVATVVTDSTGKFAMENMHSSQDFSFKFKAETPNMHINVLDYKDEIVSTIDRGRKGKFNFDKNAYETAHETIDIKYGQPAKPTTQPQIGIAANAPATGIKEQIKEKDTTVKTPTEPEIAKVTQPQKEQIPENKEQESKNKEQEPINQANIPNVANGNGINNNEINNANTLGGTVNIESTTDFASVKLSGKTYRFNKGTVVCVLNDKGGVEAIAKVDQDGNFILDKTPANNGTSGNVDTSIYSQIVFLNYKTDEGATIKKKVSDEQYVLVTNSDHLVANNKIDKLKTKNDSGNGELYTVVYYQIGKAELTDAGLDELDKVLVYLDNNPETTVNLSAHTDTRGPAEYNRKLSDRRAKAVENYLISQGIDKKRILSKGYGKTKLINKCKDGVPCTEAEHKQNRRVEIFITDK